MVFPSLIKYRLFMIKFENYEGFKKDQTNIVEKLLAIIHYEIHPS